MNEPIISISGIRGIVGQSLTPERVAKYGMAYGTLLTGNKKVVVGKDSRITGDMMTNALISGLLATGCNVTYLGLAPTPTVQFLTRKLNFDGGIVVSASHNPIEWNALKFYKKGGMLFDKNDNAKFLEILKSENFTIVNWRKYKKLNNNPELTELHINAVINNMFDKELVKRKNFKVALDSCNAAGSFLTPKLLNLLNCETKGLYIQPNGFFPHNPEPNRTNLASIIRFMKNNKFDIGFAQDSDADRLAVLDEKGRFLSEEYTVALAVLYILSIYDKIPYLKKHFSKSVAINLSTTRLVEDIAKKFNAKVYRTPVGELNVAKAMIKYKCVIGGEGNGGVIYPLINYGRDSLSGISLILQLLSVSDKKLSQILEELPVYYMKKMKFTIEKKDSKIIFEKFKKIFNNSKINEEDGLKFDFDDSWIHIRTSNTEPIIRIIVESQNKKRLNELLETIEKCVA